MEKTKDRKLFYGLFVFPLLIAVGMAVLLCSVVLLTHEDQTPESLLADIKKISPSKRWQKAFELSNEINRDPKKAQDPIVLREMVQILRDPARFDAKTRGYMALALSMAPNTEAASAILESLDDRSEEYLVFALWALGRSGGPSVYARVKPLLSSESAQVRTVAAYVLGARKEAGSKPDLVAMLDDPAAPARWNAALSLARLGNAEGYDVLVQMLDRTALESQQTMTEEQIESAMMNAIKGLILIPRPDSAKILVTLSREDKNLKVRQAAMNALSHLETL